MEAETREGFEVRSRDGTPLAVWAEGKGPPLVLVHGSVFGHELLAPLVARLKDVLTTFSMNRRGFPPSGDSGPYSVEREFEDVAAVAEEVASRTGQPVALLGHSYGAGCALGAAARTARVSRLVIYEPSLGMPYPPGWIDAMEGERQAGRPDEVIRGLFLDVLGSPEEDFAALRDSPEWPEVLHAARTTVLREAREEHGWTFQPGALDGLTAPTLVLMGTESPAPLHKSSLLALAELRNARVHVLKGHGHAAFLEDPALVAEVVRRFVLGPGTVADDPA